MTDPNKREEDTGWWEELSDIEQKRVELDYHLLRVEELRREILHLVNKEVLKDIEGIDDLPV